MGGLNNLLSEIQNLARDEANRILHSAETEALEIENESNKEIGDRTKEILAKADTDAKNIMERGISNRKIQHRNEILTLKQDIIRNTVEKAKQKIINLPDAEYFSLLKGWAGKTEISGDAVVYLNENDSARNKGDFLEGFPKDATVSTSDQPAHISGGFLAVCGGVTVNCSVDSVFESHADAINRELRRILFD